MSGSMMTPVMMRESDRDCRRRLSKRARGVEVVIATTNPRHLERLASAKPWSEIVP